MDDKRSGYTFSHVFIPFDRQDGIPTSEVMVWTAGDSLLEIVEEFKGFLLACGFTSESVDSFFIGDEDE
jgi:hypothetical protein